MWRKVLSVMVIVAAGIGGAQAQEDALGVPGPIRFEGQDFILAWTSNPSPTYFKQEYVPDGQTVEAFNEMLLVEASTAGVAPTAAAQQMVAGLEQRKASDPMVNYEISTNPATGELLLDFVLSDDSAGLIVEWNAYRYVPINNGVALFAISHRAYGVEVEAFLNTLKDKRPATIQALADMDLPDIKVD